MDERDGVGRLGRLCVLAALLVACNAAPGELATVPPTAVPSANPPGSAEPPAATVPSTTATAPTTSSGMGSPAASSPSQPSAPDTAGPDPATPAEPAAGPLDLGAVDVALETVAELDQTTAMALRPGDDALYVAERAGRVVPVRGGEVGAPILDISARTSTGGERGLLGIAWAPGGGTLYVSSSDSEGATRLEGYEVGDDGTLRQPDLLLRVAQPASNHNGGNVLIGPDGHLWLGLGDGGAANDQFGNGQDPTTLLATMVRIAPGGCDGCVPGPGSAAYGIPPDNPWARGGAGAPEVWAYGLRNPWRFSFDRATGDLWIADVGQGEFEEVDFVPAGSPGGANFGWPVFEGDAEFNGDPEPPDHAPPVHVYSHERGGCSITGGVVYRGAAIPALQGAYLYSDFCDGRLFALDLDRETGEVRDDLALGPELSSVVSFGEDAAGEVYALSLDGPLARLVPAS